MKYEKNEIQDFAKSKGIKGVVDLSKRCGLTYDRTVRVWKAMPNAKVSDVKTVLNELGLDIVFIAKGEICD